VQATERLKKIDIEKSQRTRRSHIVRNCRRQAALAAVVASATLVLAVPVSGAGSPSHVRLASNEVSAAKPSPGHLIVGAPIKLPSVLYTTGAKDSASLVTPSQARTAATAMWNAWQSALYANDTRALTQLAVVGPMLDGTIYNCAFPSGRCSSNPQRPMLGQLEVAVPKQRSFPLYFISAIRTTNDVQNSDGLDQVEPWMELQILTKKSSTAPWQLSFDSGYNATNGVQPPFPPFDFGVGSIGPSNSDEAYNGVPLISTVVTKGIGTSATRVPTDKYLPLLATYWQSYKDVGHAPRNSVFLDGGDSSGEGKSLAESREGSLYAGNRSTYQFAFDPRAGTWHFTVGGGYPMVCGSVLDAQKQTPVSGLMNQNSDEVNYGVPLQPGAYFKITTSAEHEVCVYYALAGTNNSLGGLSVAGNDVYVSAVTGHRAPNVLVDLENDFDVLSNELAQYSTQYKACVASNGKSCVKSLAQNSAEEFALFDNDILSQNFPSQFDTDVKALDKTTRRLNALYESVSKGNETAENLSSIQMSVKDLKGEFNKLVKDLS
jgi:hypothetical protein